MFWFDKHDSRVTFGDIRSESHKLSNGQTLIVDPDQIMDFRAIPFKDSKFHIVVFDPPHLKSPGLNGWQRKKYGGLSPVTWRDDLTKGFSECFRVLQPGGVLVFKWNEHSIRVSEILALTPEKPLFGNRFGSLSKSHWIVFQKPFPCGTAS